MKKFKKRLKYSQLIVLFFALVIFAGALLLMLPISSRSGESTPFINALFTATSANCVTGLIIYDTYSHWSLFGQTIILILIQIGGLGFMAIATLFSLALRKKIGLSSRILLQESVGSSKLGGVVRVTRHLVIGTLMFEVLGTIILAFRFCPKMGFFEGLYNAFFHSVSAFCNAGFDLMGKYKQFSSLTTLYDDPVVTTTLALLIIIGGLGFLVWEDLLEHKTNFKKYALHTKAVLVTTASLIICSTVLFFFIESDLSMSGMNVGEKISNAFFQAVTPRTAGFNALDLSKISDFSVFSTILLMIIGGSPGSTAGGIKTTVFFLLFAAVLSTLKGKKDIEVFKRRIEDERFKKACTMAIIYISIAFIAIALISILQDFSLLDIVFEVFSAIGTVGLTLGITPHLSGVSKIIIMLLMYFGRVGILSIIVTFANHKIEAPIRYPAGTINIG